MPRTYRISLQPPLQEDLYCLELYASYSHSLAAVAATIGLVVLSGTLCRILTEPRCCHRYSGSCCVVGALCILCFIRAGLRYYSSSCCVVWGTMLFMLHTYRASLLQPLQYCSSCCVVWGIMHFMLHTYRASVLPPLQ